MPLALLALLGACGPTPPAIEPPPPAPSPIPAEVVAAAGTGVDSLSLRDLLSRHWDWSLREGPVWATKYGDHRFDDRLDDNSASHLEARRRVTHAFLDEARALRVETERDRVTLALFTGSLDESVASEVCAFETWNIGTYANNPVSTWNSLPEDHQVKTPRDGQSLIARYRQIPRAIDDDLDNLRRGAEEGRLTNAESMKRVIAMVDKQLAQPTEGWQLSEPVKEKRGGFTEAESKAFAKDLLGAIEGGIRPALKRYRDTLEKELLPRARGEDRVGVNNLPDGARCYKTQIRAHTSLDKTADELHQLGLQEIERINAEMVTLGEKLFGTREFSSILKRLRTDPALYFQSADEIDQKAQRTLAAAKAKMGQYFGVLPRTDCVVHRIAEVEAPFTTVAYYREPNPDGSKGGEYMINVSAPETRPRYEAAALAFHESIPGHHLQIAIAFELPAMPAFRRFFAPTAFTEGWALYIERVADEMGLYDGDLDRMGMLSYDAWRASRLVVDTGIHEKGWTREQAVSFMLAHTALAENNIRNEVDRYIFWPGQALGYKVGQLTIRRLRRKAEEALGQRFELKAFHDIVLGGGAVTLEVLEGRVDRWIGERSGILRR